MVCRADAPPAARPPPITLDSSWELDSVCDAMSGVALCIHRDVALAQVVELLVEHSISGAPVVDDLGRPVGMVSRSDILMDVYECVEESEQATWMAQAPRRTLAADVMTPRCISISEHGTLVEAVRLMAAEGVHRLPVVSAEGAVVGILSTLDVMAAMADRTRPRPERQE